MSLRGCTRRGLGIIEPRLPSPPKARRSNALWPVKDFPADNNDMQESVFGVRLLLITYWLAYLIRLALSVRQSRHLSFREFLRLLRNA
jgi:hypothetical protein